MRKYEKVLAIVLLVTMWSHHSVAADSGAATTLILAKYAGMCGVFVQMSAFQESTKMPGGDEFIARFLNTELARLGTSIEDFVRNCNKAVAHYDGVMQALDSE